MEKFLTIINGKEVEVYANNADEALKKAEKIAEERSEK